jgi:uncharacterized membrane protein
MVSFLRSKASSLAVTTVAVVIVLPISIGVRLAVLSFSKGAIVVYSVLFLTLERGWSKYNKPCWLA